MPEISVVIPCYNGAETLPLQLESIASQENPPDFEVIVVDNGSTDNVRQVVSEWQRRMPHLRYVYADEFQGVSYARNVGLREALSAKIAFCDDDDCTGKEWVASAAKSLDCVDFVTGSVLDFPDSAFSSGLGEIRALMPEPDAFVPPTDEGVNQRYPIVMGGNCAITRQLANQLQGFDQSFFPGAEDNDIGLRLVAAGHPLHRCDSMVVMARTRATSRGAWQRSYQAGLMHMRLCAAHDLWDVSPHLRNPRWIVDLGRAIAAAAVMALRPSRRDWRAVGSRIGLRVGQLVGFVRYRVFRRQPKRQLGLGLDT